MNPYLSFEQLMINHSILKFAAQKVEDQENCRSCMFMNIDSNIKTSYLPNLIVTRL